MKQITSYFLIAVLSVCSLNLSAQKVKKQDGEKKETAKPPKIHVYLGNSDRHGGTMSKREFDSYLKQGLTAKDSSGNVYRVDGFTFSYAERNLYEDSVGNLMVLTDYVSEFCPGDTVTPAVTNNIYYKTKAGDTAYFDNIRVKLPDGKKLSAKGMKFVLTR